MFDSDLAVLYGAPTKHLNEAVKRNPDRFPTKVMFPLNPGVMISLRSQIAPQTRAEAVGDIFPTSSPSMAW
jgi:hypothetical protein